MKKILFLLLIPIFAFSQGWDTNNGLGVVPVTDTTGTPDIGILYFCFADSNYYSWKEGNYWAFVNEWTVENNTISLKDVSIDTIDIASSVIKAHVIYVGSVAIGDTTTGDHDAILYFSDDGSGTAESIKWDDGTEKFIASDDLDVTGRIQIDEIYHIYGGCEDSSRAVAITQDQWSQVTNAWGTLFGGSESDGFAMAHDTVVVTNAGDYEGMVSLTFSGTNSNEYVFRIFDATTDTQKGFKLGVTADGTTNHAHITIPVYIEAAGNDSLVLQVTNTSGSNAATFEFGQFLLKYLHD
jgi:hypothetical protein